MTQSFNRLGSCHRIHLDSFDGLWWCYPLAGALAAECWCRDNNKNYIDDYVSAVTNIVNKHKSIVVEVP